MEPSRREARQKRVALSTVLAAVILVGCTPVVAATTKGAAAPAPKPTAVVKPPVATNWVTGHYTLPSGRDYYLHHDANSTTPKPLVLVLHGFDLTPGNAQTSSGASTYGQTAGFNAVYPNGGGNWDVTAGTTDWAGQPLGRDDIGYLADVVANAALHTPTDLTSTEIWGFSKGGMMAATAGCQRPDVFASIGVMSGQLLLSSCPHVVYLRHLHGAADTTVPAYGGYNASFNYTFPSLSTEAAKEPAGSRDFSTVLAGLDHAWATSSNSSLNATAEFWASLRQFHTHS
jgi:poly(3-hydroxybutyrate) depolymerase